MPNTMAIRPPASSATRMPLATGVKVDVVISETSFVRADEHDCVQQKLILVTPPSDVGRIAARRR